MNKLFVTVALLVSIAACGKKDFNIEGTYIHIPAYKDTSGTTLYSNYTSDSLFVYMLIETGSTTEDYIGFIVKGGAYSIEGNTITHYRKRKGEKSIVKDTLYEDAQAIFMDSTFLVPLDFEDSPFKKYPQYR